jgi:acyl-CoA thioesterase FadM
MAPLVHRLRVRYNECDAQNYVFNANYFVYFDIALGELWREALGSYETLTADGLDWWSPRLGLASVLRRASTTSL